MILSSTIWQLKIAETQKFGTSFFFCLWSSVAHVSVGINVPIILQKYFYVTHGLLHSSYD